MNRELINKSDERLYKISTDVCHGADISNLLNTMEKIVDGKTAIGVAAPQLGVNKRVVISIINGIKQVIINPIITKLDMGFVVSNEGCLSFPRTIKNNIKVKRYKRAFVIGFDEEWNPVKFKLRGIESMCIQHEVDHLNGITIVKNHAN